MSHFGLPAGIMIRVLKYRGGGCVEWWLYYPHADLGDLAHVDACYARANGEINLLVESIVHPYAVPSNLRREYSDMSIGTD